MTMLTIPFRVVDILELIQIIYIFRIVGLFLLLSDCSNKCEQWIFKVLKDKNSIKSIAIMIFSINAQFTNIQNEYSALISKRFKKGKV